MVVKPAPSKVSARTRLKREDEAVDYRRAERLRKLLGMQPEAMARFLGVSAKTYTRRAESGSLADAERLKVEMLERTLHEATRVFGDEHEARIWLESPILSLESRRPIEHLSTIGGFERVKETLAKIEYGMY